MKTCKCDYCQRVNKTGYITMHTGMIQLSVQQEFEATCMMYEHIESELKVAVDKFNGGKPLNNTQKQIIAKAIWRN